MQKSLHPLPEKGQVRKPETFMVVTGFEYSIQGTLTFVLHI